MLSEKIVGYLEGLVKIAEGQNYKIESITFYNTYAEIPEKEKCGDTKISKLERNKESGNSVRIFEGQKLYGVVTDENNSVIITLIHRHIVSLINDGRISQLQGGSYDK